MTPDWLEQLIECDPAGAYALPEEIEWGPELRVSAPANSN